MPNRMDLKNRPKDPGINRHKRMCFEEEENSKQIKRGKVTDCNDFLNNRIQAEFEAQLSSTDTMISAEVVDQPRREQ